MNALVQIPLPTRPAPPTARTTAAHHLYSAILTELTDDTPEDDGVTLYTRPKALHEPALALIRKHGRGGEISRLEIDMVRHRIGLSGWASAIADMVVEIVAQHYRDDAEDMSLSETVTMVLENGA